MAQNDFCVSLLNQYSMILYNTTLVVTGGRLVKKNRNLSSCTDSQAIEEKVKCKW
jgi:hypothetical protein